MLESKIEKKVCDFAKSLGYLTPKFNSMQFSGVPDRIFISPFGSITFIEFKSTKGVLTPLQISIHKEFLARGVKVHVINSVEDGKQLVLDDLSKDGRNIT